MNLFDISINRNIVNKDIILNKITAAKSIKIDNVKKKSIPKSLIELIKDAADRMESYLGEKKNNYLLITDEQILSEYFDKIIENGSYAVDTETTGLNVMLDQVVGFSIYTPGQKAAYIPLRHISYITGEKLQNQISVDFVKQQFDRLKNHDIKAIFANAKFDIRVMRHSLNVYISPYFDVILAARMLNENEPSNRLKDLYKKYILHGQEDAFTFGDLFKGVTFDKIPPNVGYLYAALDAEATWKMYEFQLPFLTKNNPKCIQQDLLGVADVFWDIEMPTIEVLADIEDTGVSVDIEIMHNLENYYRPKLQEYVDAFDKKLLEYNITKHYDISSSQQLAELFYDVLKLDPPDKKHPRSTDKKTLVSLNHPIVEAVKDYRSVATIVNTFVNKLPEEINPNTGKIHCSYVQVGSEDDKDGSGKAPVTGRLACKSPNMQQIPAKGEHKRIRNMFRASIEEHILDSDSNCFDVPVVQEINTPSGYIKVKNIKINDKIIISDDLGKEYIVDVSNISFKDKNTIRVSWK